MFHGDIRLGDTIDIKFCTVQSTGAPFTLAGSPVISAYPANSVTQLTAGITLTVDFDAVTGLNNVRVVASSGNGYLTATNYVLVITTGTVNSVSVVGYCIGSFSIENRSALMPATAARTLVVDAAGLADANAVKVGPTGSGTAQTAGDIPARLPAALVSGRMDSSVGAMAANTVTAAAIADAAIDAATFAAGAIDAAAIAANAIGASEMADGTIDAAAFSQGAADLVWTSATRTLTSGVIKKNVAFSDLEFLMVDSTDHVTPKTGLTIGGTRSIDGGAFGAVTGTFAEVSSGIYQLDASQADMNGAVITFRFTGTAADDCFVTVVTSV